MNMHDAAAPKIGATVRALSEKAEDTSLYLLRAIDSTLNWCRSVCDMTRADAREADRLRKIVLDLNNKAGEIDPEDRVTEALNKVLNTMRRLHAILVGKRDAAALDPELEKTQYRDSIVGAYEEAIACLLCAFEEFSQLRTAVMEHDADRSKKIGPFKSIEDLITSLK